MRGLCSEGGLRTPVATLLGAIFHTGSANIVLYILITIHIRNTHCSTHGRGCLSAIL